MKKRKTREENNMLMCDRCHETKEDVAECIDPYAREINDEEVLVTLCDNCFSDRVDDI